MMADFVLQDQRQISVMALLPLEDRIQMEIGHLFVEMIQFMVFHLVEHLPVRTVLIIQSKCYFNEYTLRMAIICPIRIHGQEA